MGDSMVPLPKKLINKIIRLEFVEMHELLPENWPDLVAEEQARLYEVFGKKKPPPVTNILTWTECFASLVSVLSTAYPNYVPEFMAYMSIIIKCSKRFEGSGWFSYDRAFRRQAATIKNLNWSQTDSTLFSLAFTGKAKQMSTCDLCFSTNHTTNQCPDAQFSFFPVQAWTSNIGMGTSSPFPQSGAKPARTVCGLYNSRRGPLSCTFGARCKFAHICSLCKGNHSRSECGKPPVKRQRPA